MNQSMRMEEAKRIIRDGRASCVVVKEDEIVRAETGPGIAPLLAIYEKEPEILKGADVFDKVIGKAAAMIIVLSGAGSAYGQIMSVSALAYLTEHGCEAGYGRQVAFVQNRSGDGMCPLEQSVLQTEDPESGYRILKETTQRLRAAGKRRS